LVSAQRPVTGPRIGVLSLQGDVREHLAALTRCGADAVPVKTEAALAGLDGLVIPGGESTTIGRLLTVFGLLEPLRQLLAAGLPAYGSCAGMILLADDVVDGLTGQPLLGGLDVTVRRNAFGRQVDSFEADLDVTDLTEPVHAVFIRAPWVERVGERVQVLATEPGGHPVVVRQGDLLATSFHPELTGDDRVHALFVSLVRSRVEAAAQQQPTGGGHT
jgi:5'-phosphate synthase pdxT subunit